MTADLVTIFCRNGNCKAGAFAGGNKQISGRNALHMTIQKRPVGNIGIKAVFPVVGTGDASIVGNCADTEISDQK